MQSNEGNTTKTKTRKCIVTGATALKKDLIRFVLSPQLQLIADIDQNLPGRGFWVKADRKTISEAINILSPERINDIPTNKDYYA